MVARIIIPYRDLVNVLNLNSNKIDVLISYVKIKFKLNCDELETVSEKLRLFYDNFNKKLVKNNSSFKNLMRDPWMRGKIEAELKQKENIKRKVGRPSKSYEESAPRTKRRKVQQMCASVTQDQIERAAIRKVKKPVAKIVRQMIHSTVPEVHEFCNRAAREDVVRLTETEALSVLIELDLTRDQYIALRNLSKSRNADLYPPYYKVLEAKKLCYPNSTSIYVDEKSASINLQSLLDHTSTRLLQSLSNDEISKLPTDLTLLSKYGCDGASGQSRYKQCLKINGQDSIDDSKVFMCSLVPVRITDKGTKDVYWQNQRTGSPRYCRPIAFEFAGECRERTVKEVRKIKEQIKYLEPSRISIGEKTVFVAHRLFCSMIDGKTCAYLTNTDSSSTCPICKAKPNEMNDVEKVSRKIVDESVYEYGLSPLHAKIRFMEFILHLAYNLPFEKWTASVKEGHAKLKKISKTRIQDEFHDQKNLLVDFVKNGSGNTNDGNTARRFFADTKEAASITKIDEEVIERLATILQTLACGRDIDADKFGTFAIDTYNMIVKRYSWYKMPWSVHRILMHGAETIKHNILPIGQLTEEAAEARNKDFRRYREHHTRKHNRVATNQDILNFLLVSSDPLISNMRPVVKKKQLVLPSGVTAMLLIDDFNNVGDTIEDN